MEPEKIKIVIVEDEFVIAEDIRGRLEDAGYEVADIFDTAEAALPFIISISPDIVLVDINLRGKMNGIEMVEELKLKANLPIAYITASSDAVTYERARSTLPHAFLVKPFTTANLLMAVDLALYHFSANTRLTVLDAPGM